MFCKGEIIVNKTLSLLVFCTGTNCKKLTLFLINLLFALYIFVTFYFYDGRLMFCGYFFRVIFFV